MTKEEIQASRDYMLGYVLCHTHTKHSLKAPWSEDIAMGFADAEGDLKTYRDEYGENPTWIPKYDLSAANFARQARDRGAFLLGAFKEEQRMKRGEHTSIYFEIDHLDDPVPEAVYVWSKSNWLKKR